MATLIRYGTGREDINSNYRVYDIKDDVDLIMPEMNEVVVFLNKIGSDKTKDPKFFWFDKEPLPTWCKVNGAIAAGTTALVLDDSSMIRPGDVLFNPLTLERIFVSDNAHSTETLTIERSVGATSAGTIADNQDLMVIGNAFEEGSVSPDTVSVKEEEHYGYTQIFRTPFAVTGTENRSEDRGTKKIVELRKEELINHKIKVERALIYGERAIDTGGTKAKRYTGGLLENITSNIVDMGAIPTEDEMEAACETVFKYGSKKKILICSPAWITEINRWGRHKLQTSPLAKEYGMKIMSYTSAHGEIDLIKSYCLDGNVFGYYAIMLDPKNIKMRFMGSTPWAFKENIQANDLDGIKHEFFSELGFMVQVEKSHAIFKFRT